MWVTVHEVLHKDVYHATSRQNRATGTKIYLNRDLPDDKLKDSSFQSQMCEKEKEILFLATVININIMRLVYPCG